MKDELYKMDILYNSGEPKKPFVPIRPLYIIILIISDTGFCEIGFHCTFFIDAFLSAAYAFFYNRFFIILFSAFL